MFLCHGCKQSKVGPAHMVPVEYRAKTYSQGSTGFEIAKEIKLCEACYEEYKKKGVDINAKDKTQQS